VKLIIDDLQASLLYLKQAHFHRMCDVNLLLVQSTAKVSTPDNACFQSQETLPLTIKPGSNVKSCIRVVSCYTCAKSFDMNTDISLAPGWTVDWR